ncbi:RNA pseudouridine synthase [Bdellovibrio bacteriovorus]|uniref:RNA pseudouridine synthase n=1 Tax=Bdellovibrio bacteriovorus TaxID=959 RepID=A0A150WMX7_BDEBC|nr:RNA pseudouridine synthase [Bdellovibrio bacteriovorus]KYG65726.1 RNA pseudouridine synthase [Bdellovibrio bacteriovorus]
MKKIPKKYQPRGFDILHEDIDIIVGNKAPGALTVAAKWNADDTIHSALNQWVRKGNPRSNKSVYVVHRLDQATSGVLIFAKSEEVQHFLKDNWKSTTKNYYAIVHGKMKKKNGTIQSYLEEDENYVVHSSQDSEKGKLAITEYEVLKETDQFSLVKINLLTGKKNQIRVHLSGEGHPIVGDAKYGKGPSKYKDLCLHSAVLEITHPFNKKRLRFTAPVPAYFKKLIPFDYD